MIPSERPVEDLAGAILDGTPIDWAAAEFSGAAIDPALFARLKILSTLADLHRGDSADWQPGAPGARQDAPDRWGPLKVLERIGGGSFGDVYRAWDTNLDREVALKLLPARSLDGLARADAIVDEGRLLARVRHPNVVTIFGAERVDDRIGLWMELVGGRTLEQALRENKRFTPAEVAHIGTEVCHAVSAVHTAGLLHRDIKAHNVMLEEDGRVVLMDFGAGRRLDEGGMSDLTGTPLYLAPEVLDGQAATVQSDVYSLGVLLYHLATGFYPVEARSVSELRRAHRRRRDGGRTTGLVPHPAIPARLGAVLERATDPRPDRRHTSAAALARDLQALQRRPLAHGRFLGLAAALIVLAAAGWLTASRGWRSREPVRVAVMPFEVTSDAADGDVLREGMARDLISRLQAYGDARVVSTRSVFSAAALSLPLPEIGRRLGASTAITGSVVRSGETVVVEARLVRLSDGRDLWKGRYTPRAGEMLDVHRTMAMDLAEALGLQQPSGVSGWPTGNPKAYALYVQGMASLDRYTREGQRLALQRFEQALDLDPDYAQAHAGVAQIYLSMAPSIANVSGEDALRRATGATERAMSLDDMLPEAHVAAAALESARADWDGADRAYRRAIELGPSNVLARQQYAHWLSLLGRFDDALEQAQVAESLDRLSPRSLMAVASVLRFARRYEEAILQAHKALELDQGFPAAHLNLGHNYQGLGRFDEAIAAFERMPQPTGNLGHAYALAGRATEARALIARFEQEYAATGLRAGDIAQIYSGLGEIDRAFEWLDRMEVSYAGGPSTFKVAPVWDPLRSDPRFAALLSRYGLED